MTEKFDVIHWDKQHYEGRDLSEAEARRVAEACDLRRPASVAANGLHAKVVPVGSGKLDTTVGSLIPGGTK